MLIVVYRYSSDLFTHAADVFSARALKASVSGATLASYHAVSFTVNSETDDPLDYFREECGGLIIADGGGYIVASADARVVSDWSAYFSAKELSRGFIEWYPRKSPESKIFAVRSDSSSLGLPYSSAIRVMYSMCAEFAAAHIGTRVVGNAVIDEFLVSNDLNGLLLHLEQV